MRRSLGLVNRVLERPRLVLVITGCLIAVICFLIMMIRVGLALQPIFNIGFCLMGLVVSFVFVWKKNGYRFAVAWLLLFEVIIALSYALFLCEFSMIAFFVVPSILLLFSLMDLKRISSRKNCVIVCLVALIICGVLLLRGIIGDVNCSVWPIVIALVSQLIALIIKPLTHFDGIHFSVRKYLKPKVIRKVSVVVPNYNYARYLDERICSILKQTYPIYELIILDDKSTDDSVKVIKRIMAKIKEEKPELKISFIPNEENSGNVFKQWKKAFEVSKGDYVWICEADDSCNKHFLNAVMSAFNDESVVMSYSESCTIGSDGKKQKRDLRDWIDMFSTHHWKNSYVLDGKDELKQVLCVNNTIANVSSVVFRNEKTFRKYLDEAQKFRLAGDWYFYSKVLLNGRIAYHDESLNYHRMHSKGVTLTTDNYVHYNEVLRVQDSIMNDVDLNREAKKKVTIRRKELARSFGLSKDELKYREIELDDLLKTKDIHSRTLLSVIICAYNMEEYIERCLNSLYKALPERSEIVVIDDGSTDKTADIIKRMQTSKVKYYYKKNGGLASAKNYGLQKASGNYVIFLDADDEIAQNGYETMLKKAVDTNADVVVCDMELVYEEEKRVQYCSVYHYEEKDRLIGFLIDGLMASSNNKIVKKELFDGLSYPEGKNNEDVAVTPVVLARANNLQYIPSAFYKYYQREGSIQNSEFGMSRLVLFDTCEIAFRRLREYAPNKATLIKGVITSNQLIATLYYVICDIKNIKKRYRIIEEFCKRYKLIGTSKYVEEYCRKIGASKLETYILLNTPQQISDYVRRSKNLNTIKSGIRKILGKDSD